MEAASESTTSSPPRTCSRCRQAPARPRQWYCLPCHAEAAAESRQRVEDRREQEIADRIAAQVSAELAAVGRFSR